MATVGVGSKIFHDGDEDYKVTNVREHKGVQVVTFENDKKRVSCRGDELVLLAEENAFYLPGRLLSREHRGGDEIAKRKALKAGKA